MLEHAEPTILIVDDDSAHGASVRDLLAAHQYQAVCTTDNTAVAERLTDGRFEVLILDLNMPGITGIDILESLQKAQLDIKTIVLSGEKSLSTITPILRLGAYDYLAKPYEPQQLLTSVGNALDRTRLEQENTTLASRAAADHKLHQFLINASPDLIYMLDDKGRFSFLNEKLDDLFGVDRDDVLGQPWQQLIGTPLSEQLRFRFDERRTGKRATRNYEFDFTPASGRRRIFEFSATGLYENRNDAETGQHSGTYGVLRDVTEARRTARDLVLSQQKFYGLFMESPDAVFISRLDDGRLIEGNDKFRDIKVSLGSSSSDYDTLVFADEPQRAAFVDALTRSPNHLQFHLERESEGSTHYFELNARLLDIEDESCILATVRDRTAERMAEQDRLYLQSQLQQASKMEAIGQLAGGIAHDFNNILASIIGYAELVQSARTRLEPEQIDNYLGEVVTAGHRARDLISQMLTFTRANRGEPRAVDISEAIADVSRMLRAAIPTTIDIRTEFAAGLAPVLADPVQLQQIIINLLINARDAIEGNGSIHIDVRTTGVQQPCACCGERLEGDHLQISVRDSGHGIEPELQAKIFEMYFTTREHGKGTGIGLWLINNLVHEYAGHITLQSKVGRGTTFNVHLPMAPPAGEISQLPTEAAAAPLEGRIVVVDDEVSVSSFIGEVLRDHGYDVVIFNESPSALRYLETNIDDTAMLLTDQVMPMITGLDLSQRVRSLNPQLPIILITAFTEHKDARRFEEIGINRFLAKPFRIDELLRAIRELSAPVPGRVSQEAVEG